MYLVDTNVWLERLEGWIVLDLRMGHLLPVVESVA
jgi:hypothetical protein